jgi:glutathione S-transferase
MLALYHFDRSTAAQKVRLALAEKELAWESRYVDPGLGKREQHDPGYLALNPRGVVPTLLHDGKVIRESQVILEYLEDVFPAPPLRPAEPAERARMRLWTKLAGLCDALPRLKAWQARIMARPAYAEAIVKWGDATGATRAQHGKAAFPRIKAMWDQA